MINENLAEYHYDLAVAVSNILNISSEQSSQILNQIDADTYINVSAAADKGDKNALTSLLKPFIEKTKKPKSNLNILKKKLENVIKDKKMDWDEKFDQSFNTIRKMSKKDWKLVWPDLDQTFLKQLYQKTTHRKTANIGQEEATKIWSWIRENIMEQAIYENQLVNIVIPNGPKNTVGIIHEGKTIMVAKSKLSPINEHVLGMTQMPTITRIRELAGLDTAEDNTMVDEANGSQPTYKVIIELDYENPMENSRVAILGGAGSYTINSLKKKIHRELKELNSDLDNEDPSYRAAGYRAKQLTNSINTLTAAYEDLAKARVKEHLEHKIPEWVAD